MNANTPVLFDDSLAARAAPVKYRRVGNPYAFLNYIGIDAILERIYKAANIVDVAEEINISITLLLNWLENEGHMKRVEDAHTFSAEGYLSEAAKLLRTARTDFDLKKADKVANHGRFMASKLDKRKYGTDAVPKAVGGGVTFIMHMGNKTAHITTQSALQPNSRPAEARQIRGEYPVLTAAYEAEQTAFVVPEHVYPPDDIGPFEDMPFEPDGNSLPEYLSARKP